MKSKLFTSKRFFAVMGSVLLVLLILLGFWKWNSQRLPEIFAYVPANFEQLMINRPAKNIGNTTSRLMEIPQAVQAQFQQIEVMIIAQNQEYSGQQILFLETKNEFSPEDFLKTINPETEITYTYLRLADGAYVFAPQQVIKDYTKPDTKNSFFGNSQLAKYKSFIKTNSLSVISHNSDIIRSQEQYAQLLQNVGYFIMGVDSSKEKTIFTSYLIFAKPQETSLKRFDPQFTSYLKDSTIAYLELGDVITALGIDPQQLLGGSGENSVASAVKNQFISKLFAEHLGVVLSKGNNVTNVGLTLISEDKGLYTTLQPMMPAIGEWLQTLPLLSGASLVTVSQPGKVGYDITMEEFQKIGLYLEQSTNETKITLGSPVIEGSSTKKLLYQKNSLATLKIDLNQVIGLYKQVANIGLLSSSVVSQQDFLSQLENKTFYGNIALDSEKATLEGQIK